MIRCTDGGGHHQQASVAERETEGRTHVRTYVRTYLARPGAGRLPSPRTQSQARTHACMMVPPARTPATKAKRIIPSSSVFLLSYSKPMSLNLEQMELSGFEPDPDLKWEKIGDVHGA